MVVISYHKTVFYFLLCISLQTIVFIKKNVYSTHMHTKRLKKLLSLMHTVITSVAGASIMRRERTEMVKIE